MRWKIKYPDIGDERIVNRFLIFPKKLWSRTNECDEIRWLERCNIIQRFYVGNRWGDRYWD
jgi:hypothetical protein